MNQIPYSKRTLAPANTIVAVADVKNFLRIDLTDDDALIALLISSLTTHIEKHIDQKLITQNWSIYFDSLPYTENNQWWDGVRDMAISELRSPKGYIELPFGPMQTLTNFFTFDNADVQYTFDPTQYAVDNVSPVPRVALRIGAVWPSTVLRPVKGVQIDAVFGYGPNASDVPEAIQQALLIACAKIYENRGDDEAGEFARSEAFTLPPTAAMLLEPFRRFKVGR